MQVQASLKVLPMPGKYIGQFTATMSNVGGAQYARQVSSRQFTYIAVHGPPAQLDLLNLPAKVLLGVPLEPLQIAVKDSHGNHCSSLPVPSITWQFEHVHIDFGILQWTEVNNVQQLAVADINVHAESTLQFDAANSTPHLPGQIRLDFGKGETVAKDFEICICPGEPKGGRYAAYMFRDVFDA